MLDKINKWIPLLILIVVVVILYFVFSNKKDTESQSNLLLAMAEKLKVQPEEEAPSSKLQEQPEPTEEEKEEILRIADILCFGKQLNADDKKFYKKLKTDIDEELENSKRILSIVIDKFLTGSKDFEDYEKEFYEANKEEIDSIVQYEKLFTSIVLKLTQGQNDFSPAELEFQQNYPKEIEAELKRIKGEDTPAAPSPISHLPPDSYRGTIPAKGANPPLAQGERLKIVLSLFDDGMPKSAKTITQLYSEKTGTALSKGNISDVLGRIEGKQLLYQEIKGRSDGKYFYGLPEWFDRKKLKKEYKSKIKSKIA